MSMPSRLVVGLAGSRLDPREHDWLACWQPAGVILFARNVESADQMAKLVTEIRAVLPADAEICADHEGGAVSFLQAAAGRPPAPRTLGDLDDLDLTRRVHLETGRRLRDLGLTRVLAPCCDVLTVSWNPVIGARAFGAEPELVTRHTLAALAGLQESGLGSCLKHWPGHGGTLVDTHHEAAEPVDPEATAPFQAALEAGADAVMVGHLPVAPTRPPLSLDREGVASLRESLGEGVTLWSDDVSMGALRPVLAERGVSAGDYRDEGLVDPAVMSRAWLEALEQVGCHRLLLRGIPWRALPVEGAEPGPSLPDPPPPIDLAAHEDVPVYDEAFQRAADNVALRPGPDRVLWLDCSPKDRLGSAAVLEPALTAWWPRLVRLDATQARLEPGEPFAAILVTSHRPLTMEQANLLEPLMAAVGTALVGGHPSLKTSLGRLLGPGWRVDALFDLSLGNFKALKEF